MSNSNGGRKVVKKILGTYVKFQIAKYAIKFGIEAAQLHFRYKLGYELREKTIQKFIAQYRRKMESKREVYQKGNSTLPYNVTMGEECARECRDNDTKVCLFSFRVHLYQTLSRACFDCPHNASHCLLPDCIAGAGHSRLLTVVNRQLPGPAIQVCLHDRVLVEVHNELPAAGVALHWHGQTMDYDPYMDGVPGLSQCPIKPRETFTYSFIASFPGTHFWHGQSGHQRGDGMYGPLVVRKPEADEPNTYFYDHDVPDHTLLLSELTERPAEERFAGRMLNGGAAASTSLLVNGRSGAREGANVTRPYTRLLLAKDKRHRLRFINAAALDCPLRVVAPPSHNFTVLAADGASVNAFYTNSLVIHNGERWDVALTADQPPGPYWLSVLGEGECANATTGVLVSYADAIHDPLKTSDCASNCTSAHCTDNCTAANCTDNCTAANCTDNCSTANCTSNCSTGNATAAAVQAPPLERLEEMELPAGDPLTEDHTTLHANAIREDCFSPNVTCLGEVRAPPFAPLPSYMAEEWVEDTLFLALASSPVFNTRYYDLLNYGPSSVPPARRSVTPQINNLSLRLPARPAMARPRQTRKATCTAEGVLSKQCAGDYCECFHKIQVAKGKVFEIILINEGFPNSSAPVPVHLHGTRFWVLSQHTYNATEVAVANATRVAQAEAAAIAAAVAAANATANATASPTEATATEATALESDATENLDSIGSDTVNATIVDADPADGFTRLLALSLYAQDLLARNLAHPPLKDTVAVPPGGYVVLRAYAANTGLWLGESTVLHNAAAGQGFVLQVGNFSEFRRPPPGFPTC